MLYCWVFNNWDLNDEDESFVLMVIMTPSLSNIIVHRSIPWQKVLDLQHQPGHSHYQLDQRRFHKLNKKHYSKKIIQISQQKCNWHFCLGVVSNCGSFQIIWIHIFTYESHLMLWFCVILLKCPMYSPSFLYRANIFIIKTKCIPSITREMD